MAPKSITLGPRQWLCFTITVRLKNIFQVIYYLHFKFCFLASRSNMWQRLLIGRKQSKKKKHCCYLLKLKASLTVLDRDKTDFFPSCFSLWFFTVLAFSLVRWSHKQLSVIVNANAGALKTLFMLRFCVCARARVQSTKISSVYMCTDHYIYSHGRRGYRRRIEKRIRPWVRERIRKNKKMNFEGGFDSLRQLQGDWHRWNMNERLCVKVCARKCVRGAGRQAEPVVVERLREWKEETLREKCQWVRERGEKEHGEAGKKRTKR